MCRSLPVRCAWSLSSISPLMPMWRGSPVIFISTTSCLMNRSRTREACFKAYLRYLSTIRKCVTIWQGDYNECLRSRNKGSQTKFRKTSGQGCRAINKEFPCKLPIRAKTRKITYKFMIRGSDSLEK